MFSPSPLIVSTGGNCGIGSIHDTHPPEEMNGNNLRGKRILSSGSFSQPRRQSSASWIEERRWFASASSDGGNETASETGAPPIKQFDVAYLAMTRRYPPPFPPPPDSLPQLSIHVQLPWQLIHLDRWFSLIVQLTFHTSTWKREWLNMAESFQLIAVAWLANDWYEFRHSSLDGSYIICVIHQLQWLKKKIKRGTRYLHGWIEYSSSALSNKG